MNDSILLDVANASMTTLGKELATAGVLVNCVTPAAAETELFKQMTAAHITYMRSKIPMDRFVQPSESRPGGLALLGGVQFQLGCCLRYFRRAADLLQG